MARGGKVIYKRAAAAGGGGGGGGRRGIRAKRRRRGSGSDEDGSDEEYVVGEEEEEEEEGSCDSDASLEASQEEDVIGCSEEDEEEEEEEEGDWEEEEFAARGRRPRKGPIPRRRKPRKSGISWCRDEIFAEEEVEEVRAGRKSRARSTQRPGILDEEEEEEEYEDDDDDDFAPEQDEDDEEELVKVPIRKTEIGRKTPVRRRRRKLKPKASKVKKKTKKSPVRKRRRRRQRRDPSSDDDDFIVKDRVSVKENDRKKRRAPSLDDANFIVKDRVLVDDENRKRNRVTNGRRRRFTMAPSDSSDSHSSDCDYMISDEELRDLQIGPIPGHRYQKAGLMREKCEEKGKGKEIEEDPGKPVCGICLSEEQKGVIQGLLDCCAHFFCFACIMEWSKVESRCPVCKRRFKSVSKSARSDAGFTLREAVIRIPKRDQVYQPSEEEVRVYLDPYADVVCMECQQGGDDNLMLLCDICDSSAHSYCVGLGREVPAGNWYCSGCRPVGFGPLNPQDQEFGAGRGASSSDSFQERFPDATGTENVDLCTPQGTPQQSASLTRQYSSERANLGTTVYRLSVGDNGVLPQTPGFAASTVSGRRTIHQRIRIMLSNNRLRPVPEGVIRTSAVEHDRLERNSRIEQAEEAPHAEQVSLESAQNRRSNRPIIGCNASMLPRTHNEGTSFRIMVGAKEHVQSMVKSHLKCLTKDTSIDRRAFKETARHATHTILAACGIEHHRSLVTIQVPLPSGCSHPGDGKVANLLEGCCSSCFASFVENVVQRLVDLKLRLPDLNS